MKVSKPTLTMAYGEGWRLSLLVSAESVKEAKALCDEAKERPLDLVIKQHREKRSLTANAYAWALMQKIGQAIKPPIPTEDVYELMLRRYAPVTVTPPLPYDFDLSAHVNHAERYAEVSEGVVWHVYTGSSEYDSKQMSVFIDGIKSEAQALGIETLTDAELEVLYARLDKVPCNPTKR